MSSEYRLPIIHSYQLEVDANQVLVGGQNIQTLHAGVAYGTLNIPPVDQNVVDGSQILFFLDSQTARRVALWIGVDQKHCGVAYSERGGEIDGGGGLSDTAFLVGYCNDSVHGK